jgi:preprotein translocase subunit SecD
MMWFILHQVFLQAQFQVVDLRFRAFDVTQTKDLANVLRAGKLPATADIVQSEGRPSLGQEAIDNGTNSAIIGLL